MPADDETEDYYLRRHREALVMAQTAVEPAIQKIHTELARRYAGLAYGEKDQTTSVLNPSAVLILDQMATATRSTT